MFPSAQSSHMLLYSNATEASAKERKTSSFYSIQDSLVYDLQLNLILYQFWVEKPVGLSVLFLQSGISCVMLYQQYCKAY